MTSAKKIRRRLQAGIGADRSVRIERDLKHAERVDGFVLALGREWVLIAVVADGGYPDGLVALRIRDVTAVTPDDSFESAFARSLSSWPPEARGCRGSTP
jgi:hypothetical protein